MSSRQKRKGSESGGGTGQSAWLSIRSKQRLYMNSRSAVSEYLVYVAFIIAISRFTSST
jgi:hypothetical protein